MITDKYLLAIRRSCGYVENGTSDSFKLYQDDATREWIIEVANKRWYGNSFEKVFNSFYAEVKDWED